MDYARSALQAALTAGSSSFTAFLCGQLYLQPQANAYSRAAVRDDKLGDQDHVPGEWVILGLQRVTAGYRPAQNRVARCLT